MGKGFTKRQVLQAIKDSGAIISTIALRLDCAWDTARCYVDRWEATRKAYANEAEQIKDHAESTVIASIKNGDIQTAKWYLTRKAKDRGYADDAPAPSKDTVFQTPDIRIIIDDSTQQ